MPKTIDDIIPPSRRRATEPREEMSYGEPPRATKTRRSGGRFPYGMALAAIVVVGVCVAGLYAFAGAKVVVTPVVNQLSVASDFTATPSVGDLPYEIVNVEKIASVEVAGESTVTANDPAQGTVTIYNAQAKPQELIKNTRFETPAGLIFRIHESVTVPAGTTDKPGSVQAVVYADAGGANYNIGPSTFSVPGLKGGAAYDLVYGKSTESMTGGFSGTRPAVSAATKDAQYAKLKSTLDAGLATAVAENIPEGYVLVPGSTFITYTALPDAQGAKENTVAVSQKGAASAVIFPNQALAKAVAYKTIGSYAGQAVKIQSAEGLTLTPAAGAPTLGGANYTFNLSGTGAIEWVVDPAAIAGAVAGKSRSAAKAILNGFPEIEKAELVLKPFWEGSFPADPAKVNVVLTTAPAK